MFAQQEKVLRNLTTSQMMGIKAQPQILVRALS